MTSLIRLAAIAAVALINSPARASASAADESAWLAEVEAIIDTAIAVCESLGVVADTYSAPPFWDAIIAEAPTVGLSSHAQAGSNTAEAELRLRTWLLDSGWRYDPDVGAEGPCTSVYGFRRAALRCVAVERFGPCYGADEIPANEDSIMAEVGWSSYEIQFFPMNSALPDSSSQ